MEPDDATLTVLRGGATLAPGHPTPEERRDRFCYAVTDAQTRIAASRVEFGERGEGTAVAEDATARTSTTPECYTRAPAAPVGAAGALQLRLALATTNCPPATPPPFPGSPVFPQTCFGTVTIYSVRLTLTAS